MEHANYDYLYENSSEDYYYDDNSIPPSVQKKLNWILAVGNAIEIAVPIVIGIVFVIGLVGNILVIFVTIKTQRITKHPVHSMLVLNLAVADIVYLLVTAPYQASIRRFSKWIYGSFLCPAFYYLNIQTMAVSIFTMCALAIMRFMALMMPFKMHRSSFSTSARLSGFILIALIWILASVLPLPVTVFYRLHEQASETVFNESGSDLVCDWMDKKVKYTFEVVVICATYLIPLLLISVLYFFIAKEVFCYMKIKNPNMETKQEEFEYKKMTVMVISLVIAFMVCWFPYNLYLVVIFSGKFFGSEYAAPRQILYAVGYCVSYAHACINPIIYTFATPEFRKNVCNSFLPIKCRRKYTTCWQGNAQKDFSNTIRDGAERRNSFELQPRNNECNIFLVPSNSVMQTSLRGSSLVSSSRRSSLKDALINPQSLCRSETQNYASAEEKEATV